MGIMWQYFRDTLRLPFILVSGALAMLVEGASSCLDDVRTIIVTLRDQFSPERCEAVYLADFARSRGIVRSTLEPVSTFNNRVKLAYLWWLRGGRAGAMQSVLINYFGFVAVEIVNMRIIDPTRWAEFKVIADVIGTDLMFTQDQVIWAINELKPARSLLTEIDYVYSVVGNVPVWSVCLQSAEVVTVYPV